jgi:7,8-dihydro-6-hydroxymethylpterin dimethyltransferase
MTPVSTSTYQGYSRALCPTCRALVDGVRIVRDGKVFLRRFCPEHGEAESLISSDAEWFLRSLTYTKPGSIPHEFSTPVVRGCPEDCGLCPGHQQHSCLPIIEITNHCDLDCPVCLVDNRHDWHITIEEFGRILEGLVAKEGTLETVNLSGGEPFAHPELLRLLDMARARREIARVSVSTNGVRLAAEPDLAGELARRGVYVNLQLDALDRGALGALRGAGDHVAAKTRALANLERAGVRTTLVATVARGSSDRFVGDVVRLFFEKDFLLSLLFQPAVYLGRGASLPHDPRDRVTIPEVISLIEAQSGGRLTRADFLPLPCSHPSCFALTYLLKVGEGEGARLVPFPRFVELDRYMDLLANRGTLRPDAHFERAIRDTIDDMWTSSAQVPDTDKILASLKRAICLMYPSERAIELDERLRFGEGLVKTVFIHGFMDADTFEVERVRRCCTHYALPDGRLMPVCSYNLLYRACDARWSR